MRPGLGKLRHVRTPLVRSNSLSKLLGKGKEVFLKLDCAQLSGSFKDRGMANLINSHLQSSGGSLKKLISSSGGNAGLSVATLANEWNRMCGLSLADTGYLQCEVIVPKTTSDTAIARMRAVNARVTVSGQNWNEANEVALERHCQCVAEFGDDSSVYCHPFDDPLIWSGHSTLIDEIIEDLRFSKPQKPDSEITGDKKHDSFDDSHFGNDSDMVDGDFDCVVCSVGGGGLLNGICLGLERNGLSKQVSVVTAETIGCDSFYQSKVAGCIVTLDAITSIANTLGARRVQPLTLQYTADKAKSCVAAAVSDRMAVAATSRFLSEERLLVEPACAASVALVYEHSMRHVFDPFNRIVIQVCGGSGLTLPKLLEFCQDFGVDIEHYCE